MIDLKSSLPGHVQMKAEPTVLFQVRNPDCNLAIWRRQRLEENRELTTWLDALEPTEIPKLRVLSRRETMPGLIREACERSMPEGLQRDWIIQDLIRHTAAMFDFSAKDILKIRLDRVVGPACPRFHHDAVGVRLLCTYRGPGTEWVPNDCVNIDAVGQGLPNEDIVPQAESVTQRIPRFAVSYLKGKNAPDGSLGIVHRSPDFFPRMLLCVEPPTDRSLQAFLSRQ